MPVGSRSSPWHSGVQYDQGAGRVLHPAGDICYHCTVIRTARLTRPLESEIPVSALAFFQLVARGEPAQIRKAILGYYMVSPLVSCDGWLYEP
jgi:hypothetical protein